MNIYVARPNSDGPDYIYPIVEENETYYIAINGQKFPKKVVDTEQPWHNSYYFSSQEKQNNFYEKFYFYKENGELNFETLFNKTLTELVDRTGGSLDEVLLDLRIDLDSKLAKQIKEWYGWEEE